ncbi:IPT/TIG domain-containing protein, partial [Caulobacter sp. 17J65-9]|uniref:IPT/TIG domain-containing protein n=1 Tax=Caulobacter sp. 17J65-9 TaxID=2709382 RepID=UPI0013C62935
ADQYTYVGAPTVTGVSPTAGPTGGGATVTITGTGFAAAPGTGAVKFGATVATYTINSNTQITATSPANSAGTYDVTVTTAGGTSATNAADQYTYIQAPTVTSISPTAGPTAGGTTVVITGTGFAAAPGTGAVKFGATNATYTINSNTQITATSPAKSAGTYDITVATPGGTSATSAADQFTYVAAPTVTGITPPVGPRSGGSTVTLTGTNLSGATAVTFGGTAASGFTVVSGTQITATAPSGTGTVDIRVTTSGGTSAISAADQFTYVPTPVLSGVSPNTGPTSGGDTVVITGSGLTMTGMVTFDGTTASFTVNSDTQITVTTPAHAAGAVDVAVVSPGGSGTYVGGFTYFVPVVSLPASVAGGTIGQAYSGSVAAPHAASYSVTSGSLSPGLTLNGSTGEITGTPSGAGTWNFMVTATGDPGWTGSAQAYALNIAAPTLALAPASLGNGTVGVAYSATVTASGGTAPYGYEVVAGALPTGLTLNATTGELTGTPTAGGSFNFTVRATDASSGTGAPFTVSGAYNVTINAPTITVTPASVPSATATQAYSQTLTASGGTPGYAWDLMAGTLPEGVTLSAGGVLSGTPVETGTFNFTAMALDSSIGTQYGGAQAYTLVVAAPTVTVSPSSLPNPRAGTAYSQTLSASGAAGPYTFAVTAGTLPAGLTLSGGVLSGTPTETGVFNVTVTATDSTAGAGFTGSQAYTLTVGVPNFDLQPSALPNGQQGESYSHTLVASGGTAPYTYTVTGGTGLPAGVTLGTDGVLSGTPTQSGAFTFAVIARDSTTGSGGPYQVGRGYTWTVDVANPPVAAAASALVPYASAGTAIDLTGKVSGVSSSIAIGTAPEHGTVAVSGYVVTYTPAATYFGADAFTYTVTGPGGTSAPATVSVTVGLPPVPTAAAASAPVPFNGSKAIDLTASVSGVYSSIAVASGPAHGTTSVSGMVVTYTPATDHYGADSFTYTATGPGGTSAPATVSLTVDNPPPPNPAPPAGPAQVVAGDDVGVTITNTGGLATGVQITTPPAHGTVTVETLVSAASLRPSAAGFVLTYVPNPGYSGPDSFAYALVGPGGTSQPQQVQVTVLPSVTLQPISVSTLQGVPVQVDVTAGASGGPYTAAAVVSVGPNSAGTASFAQVGTARVLTFTPADDFTGVAVVTYTVSNANSTSAPSTVTITVDARPNPALDADVRGLIGAQVQAAQRFVDTQVQNFSQRNEQLHGESDADPNAPRKHALGLTFGFGDYASGRPEDPAMDLRRREMPERPFADQARRLDEMALAAADADAGLGGLGPLGPIGGGKVALWSAGSIDFGQRHADAGGSKLKFTTSGVSLGADIEVADGLFVGVGAGYGYDATDIGSEGTHNASRSYMGAVYGSWRIAPQLYLDGVAGLGELQFDSRRIAANDATVWGRRDGSQAFGSLSLAYDHHDGPMTVSSYGRVTVSKAKLDAFTETGDPVFALAYDAQDVDASFGTLGVRGQWDHAMEDGSFTPRVRAEWRRQLSGADAALVRYADFLTGPSYQVDPLAQSTNMLLLGVGGDWRWDEGVALSLDYEGQVGDETLSHRVTLKVSTRF